MNNSFDSDSDENAGKQPEERFHVWLKLTGIIALGIVFGILFYEFGFLILLIIWAFIYVFRLLIGKGW